MGKSSNTPPKPTPQGPRPTVDPYQAAAKPTFDPFQFNQAKPQFVDKKVQGYGQNFDPATTGMAMGNPYARQAQTMQNVANQQQFQARQGQWNDQRSAALRNYEANKQKQMNAWQQENAKRKAAYEKQLAAQKQWDAQSKSTKRPQNAPKYNPLGGAMGLVVNSMNRRLGTTNAKPQGPDMHGNFRSGEERNAWRRLNMGDGGG
jgi:hypothetical protein